MRHSSATASSAAYDKDKSVRLLSAASEHYAELTPDEARRNSHGEPLLFVSKAHIAFPQLAAAYGPPPTPLELTAEVGAALFGALPLAIAVFPQEMKLPVGGLEPEFQGLKDAEGKPIDFVYANKGL